MIDFGESYQITTGANESSMQPGVSERARVRTHMKQKRERERETAHAHAHESVDLSVRVSVFVRRGVNERV